MRNRFWTIVVPLALVVMALGLIGFTVMRVFASDRPSGPTNEPLQTDAVIRPKIEQALRMDDRIDWELLQIEVKQGHATLYGEVRTLEEKGLAALIASTVPGVQGLTNSIIVEPARARDHRLSKSVWQVLRSVPSLGRNDTLRVFVKNSVVKLEGAVEDPVQKKVAEKAAASVPGVVTVINLIEVKGTGPGENMAEKVREKMLQEGVQVVP